MKSKQFKILGLLAVANVPSAVDEYNTLAKRPDACLEDAIDGQAFRGWHPDVRDGFLHGLPEEEVNGKKLPAIKGVEEITGIKRKSETVKSASGKERTTYPESEAKYFKRVLDTLKKDITQPAQVAEFQELMTKVSARIPFNLEERVPAERKAPKLSKKYLDMGSRLIRSPKFTKWAAEFKKIVGREVPAKSGDAIKDAETFGWLAKEFDDAMSAKNFAGFVD